VLVRALACGKAVSASSCRGFCLHWPHAGERQTGRAAAADYEGMTDISSSPPLRGPQWAALAALTVFLYVPLLVLAFTAVVNEAPGGLVVRYVQAVTACAVFVVASVALLRVARVQRDPWPRPLWAVLIVLGMLFYLAHVALNDQVHPAAARWGFSLIPPGFSLLALALCAQVLADPGSSRR
jgi:hypothetical protein